MSKEKPIELNHDDLAEVIRLAPLVSIDLIIENDYGQVLLGLRTNEPAKGYWFVPGGRIRKNESIADAFERIVKGELGVDLAYTKAEFVGVFEHMYPTNFAQRKGFGTHYVVLTHRAKLSSDLELVPDRQHDKLIWFDKEKLLQDKKVHPHTKAYFENA